MIDPDWAGRVQFYELVFGTWASYAFLVWMWQGWLKAPLEEWRYAMITFLGAGAFWINHYFQYAPFWVWLINGYTVYFLAAYWLLGIRGQARSAFWKSAALVTALVFTAAFIAFEQLARLAVDRFGVHEFWCMLAAYFGFVGLILWRGMAGARARVSGVPPTGALHRA
jgi:hypothetical protein